MNNNQFNVARWLLPRTLIVAAVSMLVFHFLPEIDIATAGVFHEDGRVFFGTFSVSIDWLRKAFFGSYVLVCVVALAGLAISSFRHRPWLDLRPGQWLYYALCLGIGPGLICNYLLKNNWGRARPAQIIEFAGKKAFTTPLFPSDQCVKNCSFPSGEASTLFIVFFAAAFLFPSRARELVAAGIVFGCLSGLVRMSQGAHFLSDVVFAGILMALTAIVLDYVFAAVRSARETRYRSAADKRLA